MSDEPSASTGQPVGRLAARLSHFENVRRVEKRSPNRAQVRMVKSGIGPQETSLIRAFGWQIQSVSIRHGYISVKSSTRTDQQEAEKA